MFRSGGLGNGCINMNVQKLRIFAIFASKVASILNLILTQGYFMRSGYVLGILLGVHKTAPLTIHNPNKTATDSFSIGILHYEIAVQAGSLEIPISGLPV